MFKVGDIITLSKDLDRFHTSLRDYVDTKLRVIDTRLNPAGRQLIKFERVDDGRSPIPDYYSSRFDKVPSLPPNFIGKDKQYGNAPRKA